MAFSISSNFGLISHRFRDTISYDSTLSIKSSGQTAAKGEMVTNVRL